MTQSDAPNEGREEKELAEINKLHVSLSNEELIKKCNEWVSSLAKTGGKSWLLHIPVNFNEDPDMLFTELSARFNNGLVKDSMLRDQLSKEREEKERLQAFKDYVHKRLDDAGIPTDPDSPHKAAGCRIGGRLDLVLQDRDMRKKLESWMQYILKNENFKATWTRIKNNNMEFKKYRRKGFSEMRPYIPGEDLSKISVSQTDTPEEGGMIARNPKDHNDQWYVAKKYFEDNLEEVTEGD